MSLILAIETSCDETAAAIVEDGRKVLANCVDSQIAIHEKYGGVVPEVAARHHLSAINQVVEETLRQAAIKPDQLTHIACTNGPGLVGTLLVGLSCAKALAWSWSKPLVTIDHLFSHVYANYLDSDLEPPFICLLVSGGHSQLMKFDSYKDGEILGQTFDDAAGEAYDKVARLLGLEYPGGPSIDRIARQGNAKAFRFPEGVVEGFNFSFSGLKTAVLRQVEKLEEPLPTEDLAASFQDAVNRVLFKKSVQAMESAGIEKLVLAGGVAANSDLRKRFENLQEEGKARIYMPPLKYCTDNAAMVASAAHFIGEEAGLDASVYSRSPSRRKAKSARLKN